MQCKICKNEFIPSKYRPRQTVCSQPECQHGRQVENQQAWRLKNPAYFKHLDQEPAWQETRRRHNRQWRLTHREHLKQYLLVNKEKRREYMREYMRRYRAGSLPHQFPK